MLSGWYWRHKYRTVKRTVLELLGEIEPEPVVNPLLLEDILENVFSHLDFNSLANVRQVCLAWDGVATPKFLSMGRVRLTDENMEDIKLYTIVAEHFPNRISPNLLLKDVPLSDPNVEALLVQIGGSVTSLTLDYQEADDEDNDTPHLITRETFKKLLKQMLPFLEELIIANLPQDVTHLGCDFYPPASPNDALNLRCIRSHLLEITRYQPGHFLDDLFLASPKLVEVEGFTILTFHALGSDAEEKVERSKRISQIRSLTIQKQYHYGIINSLIVTPGEGKLTKFVLQKGDSHWNGEVTKEMWKSFLKAHCDTLQQLILKCQIASGFNMHEFPEMKNLKSLDMTDSNISVESYEGHSLREKLVEGKPEMLDFPDPCPPCTYSYQTNFPKLRSLRLQGYGESYHFCSKWCSEVSALADTEDEEIYNCYSLEELCLPLILRPKFIPKIGLIFINVTRLSIPVQTDEVLRSVWKSFPCLEDLQINILGDYNGDHTRSSEDCQGFEIPLYNVYCMDSIITGISPEDCRKLSVKPWYKLEARSASYSLPPQFIAPSIRSLKNLRRLVITGPIGFKPGPYNHDEQRYLTRREDKITDVSSYFGFSKLKKLVYFRLARALSSVSDESIQHICSNLHLKKSSTQLNIRFFKKRNGFEGIKKGDPKLFKFFPVNALREQAPPDEELLLS